MSFFDSFKEEARQRKKDKIEADLFVEKEEERIHRERAEAREDRNFFRKKIKFVDKIASEREEQADQKKIEEIKARQAEKLKRLRVERSIKTGHTNRNKIIVMSGVFVALVVGIGAAIHGVHSITLEKQYNEAVGCIIEENYQEAADKLKEIDTINDSKALLAYSEYQQDIFSYEGKPSEFENDLSQITALENKDVQKQKEHAISEAMIAKEIQQDVNQIKYDGDIEQTKAGLAEVETGLQQIDNRYAVLVDTTKYEQYKEAVENIEQKTQVGKTILAIDTIGKVTLDTKTKIENVRKMYNDLPIDKRQLVVNYSTLQRAESSLTALENEKKRKEEEAAKKKAEEAAAESEALVADKDLDEEFSGSRSAITNEDIIVYRTNTGSKYHVSGCQHLKSKIEITLADAKRMGLDPCGTCHPPRY